MEPPAKRPRAPDPAGGEADAAARSGSEDGSDGGSDIEELARALALDRSGRLAGVRGLCYDSVSYRNFLSGTEAVAAVHADCLLLDSRSKTLDDTHWLPADAEPRFGLERLAKAVFEKHTAGASYPAAKSGAEWWVQVRRHGADASTSAAAALASTSIGFHWDMDLDVMRAHGVGLHPHLSTVTYLSDGGGPTAVIEQRRPEEGGVRLKDRRGMLLSCPAVGKHFVFDGRFLHGVPSLPATESDAAGGATAASEEGGLRVTFLVNIWLGYTPAGLRRYPVPEMAHSAAAGATGKWTAAEFSAGSAAVVVEATATDTRHRSDQSYPVMWVDGKVDVEMRLPAIPMGLGGEGPTLAMRNQSGAAENVVEFVEVGLQQQARGGGDGVQDEDQGRDEEEEEAEAEEEEEEEDSEAEDGEETGGFFGGAWGARFTEDDSDDEAALLD